MNRQERRAERSEGNLDTAGFLKVADKFIDVANRENKRANATQLHMAFLFASARYSAYVANHIMEVDDHEKFVDRMAGEYVNMLRQHLADSDLEGKG